MTSILIIATYFGERRRWPFDASGSHEILTRHWDALCNIDPGCEMDVCFINNLLFEDDVVSCWGNVKRATELLQSFDDQKVYNGKCIVLSRENVGLSFGAYNYGFEQFRDSYDCFGFIEDDHCYMKPNYCSTAFSQLGSGVGAVAGCVVAQCRDDDNNRESIAKCLINQTLKFGDLKETGYKYASGGVCFALTKVLDNVVRKFGRLAFVDKRTGTTHQDYINHVFDGEMAFTGNIDLLGYGIEMNKIADCCVRLKPTDRKRNRRRKR